MKSHFLKFKRRAGRIRILKSVLSGLAAGLFAGGLFLLLSRLAVISIAPIISLPVGAGAAMVAALAVFFAIGASDKALAKRLDSEFSLNERVQTMIEHAGEDSGVLQMQRATLLTQLTHTHMKSELTRLILLSLLSLTILMLVKTTRQYLLKQKHIWICRAITPILGQSSLPVLNP